MTYQYRTRGTCSQMIEFEIDEQSIIRSVQFYGGCQGNTQGLSALLRGMAVDDAISRLSGIQCGMKGTSCPDQFARALRQWKEETRNKKRETESEKRSLVVADERN